MKNYLRIFAFLIAGTILWSCNDDDEYANFHYVASHIDSVVMPDTALLGSRIPIKTFTQLQQNCEQFQVHGYDIVGNERTVTTWLIHWDDVTCAEEIEIDPMFYFEPLHRGTYHFRFWAGQDEETQEDIFITKDITIQ